MAIGSPSAVPPRSSSGPAEVPRPVGLIVWSLLHYARRLVSESLLLVCRVALLGLVYLMFFRVLRVVWVELRAEISVTSSTPVDRSPVPAGVDAPPPTAVGDTPAAVLHVLAPPSRAGAEVALEAETTIGRAPGCAVVIADSRASKIHARLHRSGDGWRLEDLGSTNGTLLNDEPLSESAPVGAGDRIQIADHVLEFR